MKAPKPITSFRLSSLLRLQKDPKQALELFLNPNPNADAAKPFRYSNLSYDLIITKLGRAKMFREMEYVLQRLKNDTRLVPEEIIFCNIIGFYARARLPQRAFQVFDEMPSYRSQRTVRSWNSFLNALLKCGIFDMMEEFFEGMDKCVTPDACTYNILIHGCCLGGRLDDARKFFREMLRRGLKPNLVTFRTLIHGFSMNSMLPQAFSLKEEMVSLYGLYPDAHVYASLIKGLCGLGELGSAFELKEEMVKNKVRLDTAVYNTLISGLFKAGRKDEGFLLVEEMQINGCKPDTVTYNAIINGLCRLKDIDAACKVLEEMASEGCRPDVISFNVIITWLCKEGKWHEAKELIDDMPRRGIQPDVQSYRVLFDGFSCEGQFEAAAASVLDEMIFKGHDPHPLSLQKFVTALSGKGNMDLLSTVMCSLGKGGLIDAEILRTVILGISDRSSFSDAAEVAYRLEVAVGGDSVPCEIVG